MVEVMGLKIVSSRSLEWHHLPTKFHENLPVSSEVISREHTDRQTGDLISLPIFFFGKQAKNVVHFHLTFCSSY
jgi:hypothetical protein